MNRLNLVRTVMVNPTFSWTDWELYDMPRVIEVAERLNRRLKMLVNHDLDRDLIEDEMLDEMDKVKEFGALDSDARRFLKNVLDEIFGD